MAQRDRFTISFDALSDEEKKIVEKMKEARLEPDMASLFTGQPSPVAFSDLCPNQIAVGVEQLLVRNLRKHGNRILSRTGIDDMLRIWKIRRPEDHRFRSDAEPLSIVHLEGPRKNLPGKCVPGGRCDEGTPHYQVEGERTLKVLLPRKVQDGNFRHGIAWSLASKEQRDAAIASLGNEDHVFGTESVMWMSFAHILKMEGQIFRVVTGTVCRQMVFIDAQEEEEWREPTKDSSDASKSYLATQNSLAYSILSPLLSDPFATSQWTTAHDLASSRHNVASRYFTAQRAKTLFSRIFK